MRAEGPGIAESGADDRMVIYVAPLLTGSTKLPENVAPASRRIVSPGCALSMAACRSPPAATLLVVPTGGFGITGGGVGAGGGGGGGVGGTSDTGGSILATIV